MKDNILIAIFVVILFPCIFLWGKNNDIFISVWDTRKYGCSLNNQIKLPLVVNGEYDFNVDWGDGEKNHITTWNDPARLHNYENPGIYTVKIKGSIEGWSFFWNYNEDDPSNTLGLTQQKNIYINILYDGIPDELKYYRLNRLNDNEKILEIRNWGALKLGLTDGQFSKCKNLSISARDIPDLSNTTSLVCIFSGCSNIEKIENIEKWDVSNIEDLSYSYLFYGDIGKWDVSKVKRMTRMFSGADQFNYGLSFWDVSKVTNMVEMFWGAESFNQDISSWNVSKVEDMRSMFCDAKSFNQDLSSWDVSNVQDMSEIFCNASSFNGDISKWNVSNIKNMNSMFWGATSFDQDLSSWDFSSVETIENFLRDTKLSTENYDTLLISLSKQNVHHNLDFHGGNSQYSVKAIPARNKLILEYGWIITDGGEVKVSQNQ